MTRECTFLWKVSKVISLALNHCLSSHNRFEKQNWLFLFFGSCSECLCLFSKKRGRVSVVKSRAGISRNSCLAKTLVTRKLWIEILFYSLAFLLTIYAFVIKSLTLLVIPNQTVFLERFRFCSVKPIKHTQTHTHTHTQHTHTHTHTHTLMFVFVKSGTSHRRNGFYTVQTVCAIALHLPYT